uniref:Uncharacterized protein n=1 Tax=Rhizophora mucronata TaxID=61149 RepID=A0A2P2NQ77_RHIMU
MMNNQSTFHLSWLIKTTQIQSTTAT